MRHPMAAQPATREGRAGLGGKSERPILPEKPGNAGGGKGPWFKSNARRSKGKEIGVSLITPESVWQLQEALHAKAKREPACRFHSLYDKLYRKDVLLHAWRCCRANGGAPGLDTQTWNRQAEAAGSTPYNRTLRGWGNYFCLGAVSRAFRAVDNHARHRLRQWLNGKHRSRGTHPVRQAAAYLHEKLGLLRLERMTRHLPWAKA